MKQLNIALAAAVAALTFGMASQASAADVQPENSIKGTRFSVRA